MTTAELAATTVRQGGREATLPTFEQFAERAAELGVPLLVELKAHGHEHGDFVGDVIAVLKKNGLVEDSLVQAFDSRTVEEIEARFPEVTTGWVVAFSRGRLDVGAADFVTMEQTSYSAVLHQTHAAGCRFLWTVTDRCDARVHARRRRRLITGYPSRALNSARPWQRRRGWPGGEDASHRGLFVAGKTRDGGPGALLLTSTLEQPSGQHGRQQHEHPHDEGEVRWSPH